MVVEATDQGEKYMASLLQKNMKHIIKKLQRDYLVSQ